MYKIIQALLTPNKFSRPQKPLSQIKAIVVHWVANPNSTAMNNRDYFESKKNLPSTSEEYGSAHEIIDLNGDVVICLPSNELAYHVGSATYTQEAIKKFGTAPNYCTYGIECTHVDWNGVMTNETYNTLVERCVDLCKKFNLNPLTDIWLHKEVVGWKDCHRFFVNNPDKWTAFKNKVKSVYDGQNIVQPTTPSIVSTSVEPWEITTTNYLKDNFSFLARQILTFGIFGYLMNNYIHKLEKINPIEYLKANRFMQNDHAIDKPITWNLLGYIFMNRLNETVIKDPIQFLLAKGFITSTKNGDDVIKISSFGAVMNNYISRGGKL